MPLWTIRWKNSKRQGMTAVEAETEDEASVIAIRQIESKYYWQGKCVVTECKPAKPMNKVQP